MRLIPILISLLALVTPAQAQLQITEEEKAVFAFFQLVKLTPDYDTWIKNLPSYKSADESMREDMYNLEDTRLKWGFGTYDHKEDALKIRADAEILLTEEDGQTFFHFRFPGSAGEEYPYFPYKYADAWIALVVNDLGAFAKLPLDETQTSQMRNHIGNQDSLLVDMNLHVKPLSADYNEPLMIDNSYFLIMSGDIAHVDFKAKNADTPLFTYSAPWYVSETEYDLLNLLQ